ncbi:hypothetical protein ACFXK0_28930 [Nocardia sp. NPDC059177]|uniref:DUF7336 domain-containing protein n=1 Tax=Nocardia sp. NPDC059177 TaxID=3346759 RepID=UPI0036A4A1BF
MTTYIYVVDHWYELEDGEDVVRTIGLYSSESKASEAVERVKKLPGFCSRPDDFCVNRFEVGKENWAEGFIAMGN